MKMNDFVGNILQKNKFYPCCYIQPGADPGS